MGVPHSVAEARGLLIAPFLCLVSRLSHRLPQPPAPLFPSAITLPTLAVLLLPPPPPPPLLLLVCLWRESEAGMLQLASRISWGRIR